ncbi:NERD domain-containing protein [Parasphingorhabdus sp.]|uniref:NERD domain-containing protein n=1 Tax=Parasphingorhabdus sp. TaxID=2709688 RepID=UPI003593FD68
MATMWPRELPVSIREDRRRRAEVRVYEHLQKVLDDSFSVFYSSPWLGVDHLGAEKDGECDFLVAHQRLGILAIEVKGGGISYDPEADQWWSTDINQFRHKIKNPVEQARSAKYELLKKLKRSGRWQERFIHICHGVIFPGAVSVPRDLGADKPAKIFCCSHQLANGLRDWIGERLAEGANHSAKEPLGVDGIAALTHILASPFDLHFSVSAAMDDAAEAMGVLEPTQFHILDHIEDIARAEIRGGAGTGKTVLAVEEAARLARSGKKTLLTCHSKPLASELSRRLAGVENLTVASFHSICGQMAERAGIELTRDPSDPSFYQDILPSALIDAMEERPQDHWEAIVVDEGQDFRSNWWIAISSSLVPFGKLRVLSDSNQRVYSAEPVPDKDLDLIPIRLKRNLRNTRAIHAAASVHYDGPAIEAVGPDGPAVKWVQDNSREGLIKAAHAELRQLIYQEEVAPTDIAMLFPSTSWIEAFRETAARSDFAFDSCDDMSTEAIVLDTVRRFKGLERPAIILLVAASDLDGPELAYVGFSRPRTFLSVVASAVDMTWLRSSG